MHNTHQRAWLPAGRSHARPCPLCDGVGTGLPFAQMAGLALGVPRRCRSLKWLAVRLRVARRGRETGGFGQGGLGFRGWGYGCTGERGGVQVAAS